MQRSHHLITASALACLLVLPGAASADRRVDLTPQIVLSHDRPVIYLTHRQHWAVDGRDRHSRQGWRDAYRKRIAARVARLHGALHPGEHGRGHSWKRKGHGKRNWKWRGPARSAWRGVAPRRHHRPNGIWLRW